MPSPLRAAIQDLLGGMTLLAKQAQAQGIVPLGQADSCFVSQ
jgi:hypothetical protein